MLNFSLDHHRRPARRPAPQRRPRIAQIIHQRKPSLPRLPPRPTFLRPTFHRLSVAQRPFLLPSTTQTRSRNPLLGMVETCRYRVQKVATHARMPSVKDRESLEAEDRALAEQQRLEHDLEIKHRREQEERQKLITWEREMELERQRRKEREQEDKRREEHEKELQKLREVERLKELERVKLQEGLLRRTASTGRLPTQDTVIFDFTEEAQNDTLQPSRSSHPELTRTAFGLNRALSPPKASTSSAAATKTRTRDLLPSAPNLQALASQKAAMRMQSTLKGARYIAAVLPRASRPRLLPVGIASSPRPSRIRTASHLHPRRNLLRLLVLKARRRKNRSSI
ncbi:hypothetical protein BDZ89DRAFT_201771 [Hymenopellis radicata]|nr:hypothetical protein BDZ89DRAFT_201771 [Hymenopellis radicata]